MKKIFMIVMLVLALMVPTMASARDMVNAGDYVNGLKMAMMEVIDENQGSINRNADGTFKSDSLTPEGFISQVNVSFTSAVPDVDYSTTSKVKIGHYMVNYVAAARRTIFKNQGAFNNDSDGVMRTAKFKLLPAVFARLSAQKFTGETNVYLKQAAMPRGEFKTGHPANMADTWELNSLDTIDTNEWDKTSSYVSEMDDGSVRVMRGVYIKPACLGCHGGPIGSISPIGDKLEGFEVGDLRAGISVIIK